MTRRAPLPQSRHHIHIYDEDWEYLELLFGARGGMKPVGVAAAIRTVIHAFVNKAKAKATQAEDLATVGEARNSVAEQLEEEAV